MQEAEVVVDLQLAYQVASDLQALVERDPLLAPFRTGVAEFVENSRRVLAGDLSIGELRNRPNARMPSREAAERIVHLVSRLPGPDGTEAPELLLALARLHSNVVDAVMHAVFAGYPEVVRAFPTETVAD